MEKMRPTYIGIDVSTQKCKMIACDENLKPMFEQSIEYADEFKEYELKEGTKVVNGHLTSPVAVYVRSIDRCFEIFSQVCDLSVVTAISGSAIGMTWVWLRDVINGEAMTTSKSLYDNMKDQLTFDNVLPHWRDCFSPSQGCDELIERFGEDEICDTLEAILLPSMCVGVVRDVVHERAALYDETKHIVTLGALLSSLLTGIHIHGDATNFYASGFFNPLKNEFVKNFADFSDPKLLGKLGFIDDAAEPCGKIARYFVEKYGVNENCIVGRFLHDCISSTIGCGITPDDVSFDVGSGDTIQLLTRNISKFNEMRAKSSLLSGEGICVLNMRAPFYENSNFVAVICYAGSINRNRVRDALGFKTWEEFDDAVKSVEAGCGGCVGIYEDNFSLHTGIRGDHRFNAELQPVEKFDNRAIEARALLEYNCLKPFEHTREMMQDWASVKRIVVGGGASRNKVYLQIIADVFQKPVYLAPSPDCAVFGAAVSAKFYAKKQTEVEHVIRAKAAALPNPAHAHIYDRQLQRLKEVEKFLQEYDSTASPKNK